MRAVLIGVIAVASFAALEGLFHTYRFFRERNQEELRRRLRTFGGSGGDRVSLLRDRKLSHSAALDALLRPLGFARATARLLEQAEMSITVARLYAIVLVAVLGAVVLSLLSALGPLLAVVLAPIAGAMPFAFVLLKRERRNRKLSEQLPDALDMMARSLRAGHALSASFKIVASEMPIPISVEFARAFEEQNLGMPFERAVLQMTKRAPNNKDLQIFAVSVVVQKETGGNLVEVVEKIAETIRGRYRFYGKVRSLTAEGRMSSAVLAALPIAASLFMAFANPDYARLLVTDRIGKAALAYACVTWVVGLLWMRRMTKVSL